MTLKVIGVGLGRTGTMSLKHALTELGYGPCHHMTEVVENGPEQVPLWSNALNGSPDWTACYAGFESAVDWPTAGFWRELAVAYPEARFILTQRSAESWADSFGETIYKLIGEPEKAPDFMRPWFDMCIGVIEKSGFPRGLDRQGLVDGFNAHIEAVKAGVPKDRLLVYEVKQGWEPLCAYLGKPVPDMSFPRTNNREDFWDLVTRAMQG